MKAKIRKIVVTVEETLSEQGQTISPPTRRRLALRPNKHKAMGKPRWLARLAS